jgi:hypothetical protein
VRSTQFLAHRLQQSIDEALHLTILAEQSSHFTYTNRFHVYEAAYLLVFSAWEGFLEESFLRFLCGYRNSTSIITLQAGKTFSTDLRTAKTALYNGRAFLLWHSPSYPVTRSQQWFSAGPHETVINAAFNDIEDFAAIRHYVAHRSDDCEQKFDAAARRLSGAGVLGRRAGRFLRNNTIDPVTGLQMPWINRISADLHRYAVQIAG